MRKSAAPSVRAGFTPPKPAGLSVPQAPRVVPSYKVVAPPHAPVIPATVQTSPSRQDVPNSPPALSAGGPRPGFKKPFSVPSVRPSPATPAAAPVRVTEPSPLEAGSPAGPARYFAIMYTKFSKKKHKVYDDGVLTLNGLHAVIQSMDGKGAWKGV